MPNYPGGRYFAGYGLLGPWRERYKRVKNQPPPNLPNDHVAASVKQLKEMTHEDLYELFQQQRRVLDAHPERLNRQPSSEPAPAEEPAASASVTDAAGEIRGRENRGGSEISVATGTARTRIAPVSRKSLFYRLFGPDNVGRGFARERPHLRCADCDQLDWTSP